MMLTPGGPWGIFHFKIDLGYNGAPQKNTIMNEIMWHERQAIQNQP